MTKLEIVLEQYPDLELLKADGFDDAILGVACLKPSSEYVLVYSRTLCIDILMSRDKMTYEEAMEYFDFNVEGAYVGEKTPIWVDDEFLNECQNEEFRTFDDIETNDGEKESDE